MMPDSFQIYVNGKQIPFPDELNIEMQELSSDDSGRTLDGTMDKDSKGFVYYITMNYEWLPSFRVAKLAALKKNTYVEVTFFCPFENRVITQTMFTGNPTCKQVGWVGSNSNIPTYQLAYQLTAKATRKQSEIPDIDSISNDNVDIVGL